MTRSAQADEIIPLPKQQRITTMGEDVVDFLDEATTPIGTERLLE